MTDAGLSNEAMKAALLMEAAQAQQRLSQESLDRLAAHTRDLDALVRDEIRRTVSEVLGNVATESRRATEALKRMRRAVQCSDPPVDGIHRNDVLGCRDGRGVVDPALAKRDSSHERSTRRACGRHRASGAARWLG